MRSLAFSLGFVLVAGCGGAGAGSDGGMSEDGARRDQGGPGDTSDATSDAPTDAPADSGSDVADAAGDAHGDAPAEAPTDATKEAKGEKAEAPPPSDGALFCRSYLDALLDRMATCFSASRDALGFFVNVEHNCELVDRALAAGRMKFDGDGAAECMTRVASLGCVLFDGRRLPPEEFCPLVFQGQVKPGGACYEDISLLSECELGSRCDMPSDCPGTCVALGVKDDTCIWDDDCQVGLGCNPFTSACSPNAAPGAECGGAVWGSCPPGYYCDETGATAACTLKKFSGDCSFDEMCALGWKCLGGTCTAVNKLGDPCKPGSNQCDVQVGWCSADGKCTEHAREGEPCGTVVAGENTLCTAGWCDAPEPGKPGMCRKARAFGDDCTTSAECAPFISVCDAASNTCAEICEVP